MGKKILFVFCIWLCCSGYAFDTSKNESDYSVEVSGPGKDKTKPAIPSGFREVIPEITIKAKTVNIITK